MKKKVSRIYDIILGAGILLILASLVFAKASVVKPSEHAEEIITTSKQTDQDIWEYTLHLDRTKSGNNCISFFAVHQYVWVYEEGKLLYSVEDGGTVFGTTSGGCWHFVEIDPEAEEIVVSLQAVYPEGSGYGITFYQGDAIQMYQDILRGSALEVLVSLLDLTIGIILLVYCITAKREIPINHGAAYFALFTIILGIWSLNETEMVKVLMLNRVAASFIGYILIMLMIAPFVFFVREFLTEERDKISYVLAGLSYVNIVVCTVLHMAGIREFKQTVIGTQLLMLAALLYLMYALSSYIQRHGMNQKARVNLIGLGLLFVAFMVDIMAYYLNAKSADVFGKFGILLYIISLGHEVSQNLVTSVREGRKAEIYRELAVKDMLTGVYNRNAYDEWVSENPKCYGMTVLTFDLNELKHCNDTLGHTMGDKYIKDAAGLLTKVFEPAGTCYRIGGDEFCVLVENVRAEWIAERIRMLEMLERKYNRESKVIRMQIAHGYATFDEYRDDNLEETRERADELMYEKKREQKQGR